MAAAITEAMRGWPGCFGVGVETTWATAVANTRWLPIITNTMQASEEVEDVPYMATINSTQTSHVANHSVLTGHDAGGDIETVLRYDCQGFAMMLAGLLGAAPVTTGGPTYTHTFSLAAAGGVALTGQNVHGSHSSLERGEIFPGVLVNTFELSGGARGTARAKFGALAYKSDGHAAISGTVSIQDAQEALGSHLVFTWNSLTPQLKSYTLKVDRGLVRRPNTSNGLYTDKPMPGGPTMITLQAKLDWSSHAFETARAAGTQSDAVLTFTGSSGRTAVFTLDGAKVVSVSKDNGANHIRELDVEWRGFFVDASNLGFKAVLTNTNADAY